LVHATGQSQGEAGDEHQCIVVATEDIKSLHKRRYLFQDVAMEMFMVSGKTCLFAFGSPRIRDAVYNKLRAMDLPHFVVTDDVCIAVGYWPILDLFAKPRSPFGSAFIGPMQGKFLRVVTNKWCAGLMSNFEYLTQLNCLAGRSPNDLSQYANSTLHGH
jgi:hypothetical protein